MTIDDETLMAYADGELDAITAKRVERAIADDPALGRTVAAHRALRVQLNAAFDPIAEEPVPPHLTAVIPSNVLPFPAKIRPPQWHWRHIAAIAASAVIGIGIGQLREGGPVGETNGRLVASGSLGSALKTQLASTTGDTRMVLSFRNKTGSYCRVFEARAAGGIACREGDGWVIRRMESAAPAATSAYRQAGSDGAGLLAAAQDMMQGGALTADEERAARAKGWK